MATQITFTYKNINYILEYTRASVVSLEQSGFDVREAEKKPVSTLQALFLGAFKAHHALVKPSLIWEIFEQLGDKENLFAKLLEMYTEPIKALTAEPEQEKKVNWSLTQ